MSKENARGMQDDAISRQSVIEMLDETKRIARQNIDGAVLMTFERVLDSLVNITNTLPSIQPDNGLQKLADEIASFKRCFKSENGDYLTGYLSALSVVEGMIADMRREVTT